MKHNTIHFHISAHHLHHNKMTQGKGSLYEKDNWLHGWTGGDVSFDTAIFKSLINSYYSFAENQAHIYLNKYGDKLPNWDKNRRQDAHDLSLKALFELAEMMSTDKRPNNILS